MRYEKPAACMSANIVDGLLKEWKANAGRWEKIADKARALGLEVWNPAVYASDVFADFLRKFPPRSGAILALGLNPGPYGMSQTGIPFTDCRTARSRLGLDIEIPGRAPEDLALRLRKPNGKWKATYERSSLGVYRFLELAWGDIKNACSNWFVGNPCPLLFLDPSGWNVTPADSRLKKLDGMAELRKMALLSFHGVLRSRAIVCIGADVSRAVGDVAESLVGVNNVVRYSHPARAVPELWARGLVSELEKRNLL